MSRVICPTAMMITWRFTLDAAESPSGDIALRTATNPMISTHQITACVLSLEVMALEVEKDFLPNILQCSSHFSVNIYYMYTNAKKYHIHVRMNLIVVGFIFLGNSFTIFI